MSEWSKGSSVLACLECTSARVPAEQYGQAEAWVNPRRNGLNCSTASLCPNQTESAENSRDPVVHLVSQMVHAGSFTVEMGRLMSCEQCLCPRRSKRGLPLQIPYARNCLVCRVRGWSTHLISSALSITAAPLSTGKKMNTSLHLVGRSLLKGK